MKKIVSVLIALLIACSFAACSGDSGNETPDNNASVEVDLALVKTQMLQDLTPTDPIEIQADALLNLYGIAAEDIESDKFVENTIMFLDKFKVIEKPTINFQLELL